MGHTGYFKVVRGGRTSRDDVFPYEGGNVFSVHPAWELAVGRAKGERRFVVAWRPPSVPGEWVGCKEVGVAARAQNGMVGEA